MPTLLHRYVNSLVDRYPDIELAPRNAGRNLWQRYWASLTGLGPPIRSGGLEHSDNDRLRKSASPTRWQSYTPAKPSIRRLAAAPKFFVVAASILGIGLVVSLTVIAQRAIFTATGPAASSSGPATTTQPTVASVRWQGPIGIGGQGIDLDDITPTVDPSSYTLSDTSGVLQADTGVTFAVWTGAANPSYAQCHQWVLTHGTQQIQLVTGMQLCVLTAAGRTALVTITSLSNDNNTAEAEATVWNLGN